MRVFRSSACPLLRHPRCRNAFNTAVAPALSATFTSMIRSPQRISSVRSIRRLVVCLYVEQATTAPVTLAVLPPLTEYGFLVTRTGADVSLKSKLRPLVERTTLGYRLILARDRGAIYRP